MKLAENTISTVSLQGNLPRTVEKDSSSYSVAVFCGSQSGNDPLYLQHATELGHLLATNGIGLVYGGGNTGLMGAVAGACLESGGKVTGVIPQLLVGMELAHEGLSSIHIVENMHIRKEMMYRLSDAIIILPGGNGTLDEMFESITWNTLGIHNKKIIILNTAHYYDALITHYEQMNSGGFLYRKAPLTVCLQPAALLPLLITRD